MSPIALADALPALAKSLAQRPVVAGFDGFVDEVMQVRGSDGAPMRSLAEFGDLATGCVGRNGLREVTCTASAAGGCAINLGDGLAALGVPVDFFGAVGAPHPAFAGVARRCRSFTPWGAVHGHTTAYEFSDGKLMLAQVSQLAAFDEALVARCLADGTFANACAGASAIALTNWSLFPAMSACWTLVAREVLSGLPRRLPLLIDLVDPSARSGDDLNAMIAALQRLQDHADVALACNLRECEVLSRHLGLPAPVAGPEVARGAARLREALGVARVVLHHRDGDAEASAGDAWSSPPGPRCTEPKRNTGAGDRFNAGWLAGMVLGLAQVDRLRLGAATAGAFVRLGHSPSPDELADLLRRWDSR